MDIAGGRGDISFELQNKHGMLRYDVSLQF
jgi:hypothetical protein